MPVDKQKIMVKGKIVKDGDGLAKLGLKEGMTIMMVGTAEEKGLVEPKEKIKFIEDMPVYENSMGLQCWRMTGKGPITTKWVNVLKSSVRCSYFFE